MEVLKTNETFIHILKNNAVTYSTERSVKGLCSLFFFHLINSADTHPDFWEIHMEGDELLLVTKGEIEVEVITQTYNGEDTVPCDAARKTMHIHTGQLLIVEKGHWHRIVLKKETELVVTAFPGNSKLTPVN